jgi:hypothetical protein
MSLRTVQAGGVTPNGEKLFGGLVGKSALVPQSVVSLTICFCSDAVLSIWYIKAQGARYRASRWAVASRSSLNSQQRAFLDFCHHFEVAGFEAVNAEVLSDFAVWLVATDRLHTVAAIRNYLSAVRTLCHMFDFDCPTPSSSWMLDWTLWGIKRDLRNPVIPKKPITPEILLRLITFPTDMFHPPSTLSWEKRILLATVQITYVIAFFSMLRASNLLPVSLSMVDPERQMVWGRLKAFVGGIVLTVVLSKTIQCRERQHEIALAERPGSIFCPVAAVRYLRRLRGGVKCGDNDLMLQIPVNGSWRPLCKDTVVTVMRSQLGKLGLDPSLYSFHCFRHGSIQTAVLAQPALELIKLQSGHLSDAVHLYTQMPGSARMVTTAKMLLQMDTACRALLPGSS